MRSIVPERLINGRIRQGPWGSDDKVGMNGAFKITCPITAGELSIIASDGDDPECQGWEHVSVSLAHRTPNWTEMSYIKDLFWKPEECVVQYHPPMSEHINLQNYCLHLWRQKDGTFPMPPTILV